MDGIDFGFVIMRNFVVLTAMLLAIKELFWTGRVVVAIRKGHDHTTITHKIHHTNEWVIRIGSLLIAFTAFFALIIATVEHVVRWLHPVQYSIPAAFFSLICIETLILWRIFYFVDEDKLKFMYVSLGCLALLSVLVEFGH